MKTNRNFCCVLGVTLFIGTVFLSAAHAEKSNKDLPRKLAVVTYYEPILKQRYGMALMSVHGTKEETLQISMVRITDDRIKEILDSGVYREAKKAKLKKIKFIDINQKETIVNVR